jgi:hypothetical protein
MYRPKLLRDKLWKNIQLYYSSIFSKLENNMISAK